MVNVGAEPVRHHLLKKLPTAFEEGDGAVGFSGRVVGFVRFGNDDDGGGVPRVDPKTESALENRGEVLGPCSEAPFEKEVVDPQRTWC